MSRQSVSSETGLRIAGVVRAHIHMYTQRYTCVVTVTVSASEEEAHYAQSTSAPLDSYFAFRARDLRSKVRRKRGSDQVTRTGVDIRHDSTAIRHGTVRIQVFKLRAVHPRLNR